MAVTLDGIFINGQKATFHPEDILSGDASAYTQEIGTAVEEWLEDNVTGGEQVTDTTLTLPGVPADAEKVGDEISALKEELNDTFNKVPAPNTFTITINKEIRDSDGAVITNNKTAITEKLSVLGTREIGLNGQVYVQKVCIYNQNNQYDGHISDYSGDNVRIPKSALYYRLTVKRLDNADMTSADVEAIRSAMVRYNQTDDSLSIPNIPADSSATGIRFTNVENRVSALEDVTIPTDVKQAILRLLKKATYTSDDMSADIRTVQDWVGIQVHYIDVSIKSNAPGTSDGSKKITSTLAYDNGLSAVFNVDASVYKVTDTGTHDRFRFYGISADLDVNDPSDFAHIIVDRIADATTVSGLDSMTEYTIDNTVTQYKIIFVYLRSNTTDYNPHLVVEEVE